MNMKLYLLSLLVIGVAVHCAEQQAPFDALRKECALVFIDSFLYEFEYKQKTNAEQKLYDISLTQRDFLIKEERNKITHPGIKTMLYESDYKEKIKALHDKFATPQTPRRKLSGHIPVDSDPRAAARAQKQRALKDRIVALYHKLGLDK